MQSKLNIYRASLKQRFEELFAAPPSLFRGAPFWSWNNKLDPDQLCRQIDIFKKMGIGGFHMHSRVGLDTPYLGDDFMAAVRACVDKARAEGMIAWLYDEDRWPSGAAGGLVTRDETMRARHLLFTPSPYEAASADPNFRPEGGSQGGRACNGKLLARYAVSLEDGYLASYRRLADDEQAGAAEETWYAYLEVSRPSSWYNNETYVDTLSPRAIRRFVEVTHERYKEIVGDDFGKIIPGIFTDEPQFTHKTCFQRSTEKRDVVVPFTDDFPETYSAVYGGDIVDCLPEIFWELPGNAPSAARYRYHDHVAERFAAAFADTIGEWCEENGIVLTGHMMSEPTLSSQTSALGDAMRSYRSFQLPGIDMLCDWQEFTTAKQAQSASHQYGRNGVLSELYGVTGWDFDFTGHKCQGDWQAALGVTVRVHHLSWVSMAGEAKRDYPASIFYQSPWWEKYSTVEDHFARVNVTLTRGKPHVRVGVIHPVESFWLCYGPIDKTANERNEREYTFEQLTQWLLFGTIDFDYICESLLPELNPAQQGPLLKAGEMAYDTVLVPPMRTIRATTLERLEAFVADGGRLVFVGEIPSLVDAVPSKRPARLAERSRHIEFSSAQVLAAVEPARELGIQLANGRPATGLLHQIRDDGDCRYVFICNTAARKNPGATRIRFAGEWAVTLLDTRTGEMAAVEATRHGAWTEITWVFHAHGHLLVRLDKKAAGHAGRQASAFLNDRELESTTAALLDGPVPVTLSEANALLLDQAEWRLGDGAWNPREEILRLDQKVRGQLGLPPRGGQMAQPWTSPADPAVLGTLEMRFTINCDIALSGARLAVEQPESVHVFIDGVEVPATEDGWWVDEAIRTLPLPDLAAGRHALTIRVAYRRKTNVEWCYLLGDFGVSLAGRDTRIVPAPKTLTFDDWTRQGLPFYTGNITYHCTVDIAKSADYALRIPHFSGAVIGVGLDGRALPDIAYAPFEAKLGRLSAGRHALDLTLCGNRHNAFGPLHWAVPQAWVGPNAWRTAGDQWCYEYMIRPVGILSTPRLRAE